MSNLIINTNIPVICNHGQMNRTFLFASTDNEDGYISNKEKLGENWYYYDKKIEYKYNSWGYRSKEINEIGDDFILVFGCSNTEGIGLHEDDMWANKLSKELNMDVLNMGMGGTSIDFQFYNTMLLYDYLIKINKTPKLVIYQWPYKYRTTFPFKTNINEIESLGFELFCGSFPTEAYPENSKWYGQWYVHGFLDNKGELMKQKDLYVSFANILWKNVGVKVINWTWDDCFYKDTPKIMNTDFVVEQIRDEYGEIKARDCAHHGHLSQNCVVNHILKKIK